MSRVNVYLPDDLADQARAAGLNVSALTRGAIEDELSARRSSQWLERAAALSPVEVDHEDVLAAVTAAREELGRAGR